MFARASAPLLAALLVAVDILALGVDGADDSTGGNALGDDDDILDPRKVVDLLGEGRWLSPRSCGRRKTT